MKCSSHAPPSLVCKSVPWCTWWMCSEQSWYKLTPKRVFMSVTYMWLSFQHYAFITSMINPQIKCEFRFTLSCDDLSFVFKSGSDLRFLHKQNICGSWPKNNMIITIYIYICKIQYSLFKCDSGEDNISCNVVLLKALHMQQGFGFKQWHYGRR